nr:hypothetical protein [Tanacetum cinerariifolium]
MHAKELPSYTRPPPGSSMINDVKSAHVFRTYYLARRFKMRVKMLELLRKMISVINGENNKDFEKVSYGNWRGFNVFGGDR